MFFPGDFVWGCATSAYQIEGGWQEGGKGLSIWDAFAHTPGKITGGVTGDVACDHFHRFKSDVALMADLGVDAYRFSISWPRIQPTGRGRPNREGIRFYSDLIDELLDHKITPWVTLYHWDLPLTLQLEHDGWLGQGISDDFAAYAEICFEYFGDRVKHWITLNEPWVVAMLGYGKGAFAPGRTSTEEPYRAAHHLLRAHGKAVDVYRTRFQPKQKGVIGMSNNCDWREPLTDSDADRAAATTSLEFFVGWFADPLYRGDYPESMRRNVADRLPEFTANDRYLIRGSSDFFGLNHYTTLYAAFPEPGQDLSIDVFGNGGIAEDQNVALSADDDWPRTTMGWSIVPWGCEKLLEWLDDRYNRPDIYLTENGAAFDDQVLDGEVDDSYRVAFLKDYLSACHRSIRNGVQLKGYFLWSLLDNFEWSSGFTRRFGLYHTDFDTLERTPKRSAHWYRDLIRTKSFPY
jgi:beta-glucosidase